MIKNKVSQTQIDVWKNKEKLYEEVKNMESKQALKYLVEKGEHTAKAIGLKSKKYKSITT